MSYNLTKHDDSNKIKILIIINIKGDRNLED